MKDLEQRVEALEKLFFQIQTSVAALHTKYSELSENYKLVADLLQEYSDHIKNNVESEQTTHELIAMLITEVFPDQSIPGFHKTEGTQ